MLLLRFSLLMPPLLTVQRLLLAEKTLKVQRTALLQTSLVMLLVQQVLVAVPVAALLLLVLRVHPEDPAPPTEDLEEPRPSLLNLSGSRMALSSRSSGA